MNVDKSVAALLYADVCVTISRSTDKRNRMDDDDDDEVKGRQSVGPTLSAHSPLLRHRSRSTSVDYLTAAATEPPDEARKQRFAFFSFLCTPLVMSLWIVLSTVAELVFHVKVRLAAIVPDSCLLIAIGTVMGLLLIAAGQTESHTPSPATFFLILLPWIILYGGYVLPHRAFYDNIGVILLFVIVSTVWNTFVVGLMIWGFGKIGVLIQLAPVHTLVFASLLASIDPAAVSAVFGEVHIKELLTVVALGESLLNNGLAVVLYQAFNRLSTVGVKNILYEDVVACLLSVAVNLLVSPLIGIMFGFAAGFASRFTNRVTVIQPLIVFVCGYVSFCVAEMLHFSGILSCICCTIVMKHCVEPNMSMKSQSTVKYLLQTLSSICEGIVFMYIGILAVVSTHRLDLTFVAGTLAACLLSHFLGVLLLSVFANYLRIIKLDYVDQHMAYGGLHGAMTFALVFLLDDNVYTERRLLITTTIIVVCVTNFLLGVTIKPFVRCLKAKVDQKHELSPSLNEKIAFRCFDYMVAGVEGIVGGRSHHPLRERFSVTSSKHVKPRSLQEQSVRPRGWSLLNVCQSPRHKDSHETLQSSSACFSQPDVFGQASSSLAQLFCSSVLRFHLGFNSWRRCSSDGTFHQCTSASSSSTQTLLDPGSSTACLDLQVLDVHETRKMKDDSKIHHIVDDLVSRPRKLIGHYHHPLPKQETDEVAVAECEEPDDHHTAPVYLRPMLSHAQWHTTTSQSRASISMPQDITASGPANGSECPTTCGPKMRKSVSFAKVESILGGESCLTTEDDTNQRAVEADDTFSVKSDDVEVDNDVTDDIIADVIDDDEDDDDDIGIVFTVPAAASGHEDDVGETEEDIVPTAVELCLPWRRNTGREPVSSVETHMVADGSNPLRADGGNWMKGLTHSLSDSESDSHSQIENNTYNKLDVAVDEENTDETTPLCSPNDNSMAISGRHNVAMSDAKPPGEVKVCNKVHDAPMMSLRRMSRHSEVQAQLHAPQSRIMVRHHPTRCGSFPSSMDTACREREVEPALSLLPWRCISDDRAIPDQQAPRPTAVIQPPTSMSKNSSVQSSVDVISTYPQPSCQSFRLSEAESRHSEPVHVQHVIDISSASHRVTSTPSDSDEDDSSNVLCSLEQLDSTERICMWLDTLSESNDEVPPELDTIDSDDEVL